MLRWLKFAPVEEDIDTPDTREFEKPFQKERVIQTIAAVEKGEPAWS